MRIYLDALFFAADDGFIRNSDDAGTELAPRAANIYTPVYVLGPFTGRRNGPNGLIMRLLTAVFFFIYRELNYAR